jgi:hypothetical protein
MNERTLVSASTDRSRTSENVNYIPCSASHCLTGFCRMSLRPISHPCPSDLFDTTTIVALTPPSAGMKCRSEGAPVTASCSSHTMSIPCLYWSQGLAPWCRYCFTVCVTVSPSDACAFDVIGSECRFNKNDLTLPTVMRASDLTRQECTVEGVEACYNNGLVGVKFGVDDGSACTVRNVEVCLNILRVAVAGL